MAVLQLRLGHRARTDRAGGRARNGEDARGILVELLLLRLTVRRLRERRQRRRRARRELAPVVQRADAVLLDLVAPVLRDDGAGAPVEDEEGGDALNVEARNGVVAPRERRREPRHRAQVVEKLALCLIVAHEHHLEERFDLARLAVEVVQQRREDRARLAPARAHVHAN